MDATTATPSTGSESSGSTGSESSTPSSGGASTPSTGGSPAQGSGAPEGGAPEGGAEKPAEPKWLSEKTKIKRGGQERELALKEALAMLDDDYEHEVDFGKEKRKAKYTDLVRGYQKHEGAENLMRQAAERRKEIDAQLEYGKQNIPWVLEQHLGVKDHRQWAADIIRQQIQEETQLTQLAQSDPGAYHRAMEDRARKAFESKSEFERRQNEQKQQAQAQAERNKQMQAEAEKALKGVGLPMNEATLQLLGKVYRKYQELGHEMPLADMAYEAKEAFVKDTFGWLDGHDDDSLLKLLGDDRRKRLRELELRHLKGKDTKPANDNDREDAPRPRSAPVKELSPVAFKRKWGG